MTKTSEEVAALVVPGHLAWAFSKALQGKAHLDVSNYFDNAEKPGIMAAQKAHASFNADVDGA